MKDHQKAEDTAAGRVQWVAPLLAPGLDAARKRVLMAEVCAQTGLSERTIRRYLARYQNTGFSGLKPKGKGPRTGSAQLSYVGQYQYYWSNMMAASVLITIPIVILFIFFQKYLVQGLTMGGVKG